MKPGQNHSSQRDLKDRIEPKQDFPVLMPNRALQDSWSVVDCKDMSLRSAGLSRYYLGDKRALPFRNKGFIEVFNSIILTPCREAGP